MGYYKDLVSFQKAYLLAMRIFVLSKGFPAEEKYSLTDQIRRSSRSVCTNLAEAFRRKVYEGYFMSKLSECLSENCETEVWLDFARDCQYLQQQDYFELITLNTEVGKLLSFMMSNPQKFIKSNY